MVRLVLGLPEELEWMELGPGEVFADVRKYRALEGLRYRSVRLTWLGLLAIAEDGLTRTVEVLNAGTVSQSYRGTVPVTVQSFADPWMV